MAEGKINGNLKINDGSTDYRTLKELNNLVTTLNTKVTTLESKSAITIGHTGRPSITRSSSQEWTKVKISLDTAITKIGSNLSLSNGGVKAAKAMNVLVSGQVVHWNPSTNANEWDCHICKNNDSTIVNQAYGHVDSNLECHAIPPKLVSLAANDILYLYVTTGCSGTFTILGDSAGSPSTCITVQEV